MISRTIFLLCACLAGAGLVSCAGAGMSGTAVTPDARMQVVRLAFATDAERTAARLEKERPELSGAEGYFTADGPTNSIIINGTPDFIRRVSEALKTLGVEIEIDDAPSPGRMKASMREFNYTDGSPATCMIQISGPSVADQGEKLCATLRNLSKGCAFEFHSQEVCIRGTGPAESLRAAYAAVTRR